MSHYTYAELGRMLVRDTWGPSGDGDGHKKIRDASHQQMIVFLLAAIFEDSRKLSLDLHDSYWGQAIIWNCQIKTFLREHGIKYVCQLANMTRRQILRIRGIGPARLALIEEALARLGLVLAGD